MRIRPVLWVALCVGAVSLSATPASAFGGGIALDDEDIELSGDAGATRTAAVTLTNVGNRRVAIEARPAQEDPGCTVTPTPAVLEPARRKEIKLEIPPACRVADGRFDLVLEVTAGARTLQQYALTAKEPEEEKPDLSVLPWAFGIALGASAALVLAALYLSRKEFRPGKLAPNRPLPGIAADWSFADSWASNITIGATLLAALFASSDILEPILGEDSKQSVALMATASAAAAALVGISPLVLKATTTKWSQPADAQENADRRSGTSPPDDDSAGSSEPEQVVSLAGLLCAAFLTVAGTGGQLGVITTEVHALDVDILSTAAVVGGVIAAVMVGVYALRSLVTLISEGLVDPSPEPPSEAMQAAAVIERALLYQARTAREAVGQPEVSPPPLPRRPPRRRRTSAVL